MFSTNLQNASRPRKGTRPKRSSRLVVESLEAREVPSLDQGFVPDHSLQTSVAYFNTDQEVAQTFTVGITGLLTEVELYIDRFSGDTGPLIMDIRGTQADGRPTSGAGQELITMSVPASAVLDQIQWFSFDVSGFNLHVVEGQVLAVAIHVGPSTGGDVTYWWGGSTGDVYNRGGYTGRVIGNHDWTPVTPEWDIGFRTYVDAAPLQPPVVTLQGGPASYVENDPPVVLSPTATVTDADSANFDTGTLTVSLTANATTDDRLGIRHVGTGAGQISVSGNTVSFGGTSIGIFSGGVGTEPLVVTLNASATPAATQALVRNLTFHTVSDTPTTDARTVQVVLTDGDGSTSDPATTTVTVTPTNDAPVVTTNTGLTILEGDAGVIGPSRLTATDAESGPADLTYTVTVAPAHGTLLLSGASATTFTQADVNAGLISYQHDGDEGPTDGFTFTVGDGLATTSPTNFNITLTPLNDPPDAVDDPLLEVKENSGPTAVPVLDNDTTDPDTGESLTIIAVTQGGHGAVVITGNGTGLTYQPAAGYDGPDSFTYTVSDGNGGEDTATVPVNVLPNNAPASGDDEATLVEDGGAQAIDVLADDTTDPDIGETLTIIAVTQGAHGDVVITGNGTGVTYAPAADYTGPDAFTYTVSDGFGGTDTATVVVSVVEAANIPPDATDDAPIMAEDGGTQTIDVLANDTTAPDTGETLTVVAVTQGQHGSVAITGSFVTYTPVANFAGSDSFLYAVSDGRGGTDFATVNVTVANDGADRLEVVTSPGTLLFTEGDAPVVVDANVRLSTVNVGIKKAVVKFSSGYVRGRDVLVLPATPGLRGSFNARTGTLTITGRAQTAGFEAALRTLQYKNASPSPIAGARTITFAVSDSLGTGDLASRNVQVTAINTPSQVALTGPALSFKENAPALAVAGKLTVKDLDNTQLTGATVAITAGFAAGQDFLSFTPKLGITGSYDANTGVLTLTGNAKLAMYQAVLRTVKYRNTSDGPSTVARDVSFTVTDGTVASPAATRTVNVQPVNDAPVLDTSGDPALPNVGSNETDPTGTTVAALLGSSMTDPDGSGPQGIAVTGFTGAFSGTWQYSVDGTNWLAIGGVSATKGLLLRSTDLIRFVPATGVTGTHSISYRAWDQSTGASGATLPLGVGATSAYSKATEVALVTVV